MLTSIGLMPSTATAIQADTFIKSLHYHDRQTNNVQVYNSQTLDALFLVTPESDYSDINNQLTYVLNDITWHQAWDDFAQYYHSNASSNVSLKLLTREAGYTKSRPLVNFTLDELSPGELISLDPDFPSYEVDPLVPHFYQNDPLAVRANVVKAQVDPDIYHKAWQIFTLENAKFTNNIHTIISKFALAVQIVRDKSLYIPESKWQRNGIRIDVVTRFLEQTYNLASISANDKEYLMTVLKGSIKTVINPYKHNRSYLKTQYRLARLSTALVDRQGYMFDIPCTTDFRHKGAQTQNHCFVDMTDRAVWHWYTQELSKAIKPRHNYETSQNNLLSNLFAILLPITLGMEGFASLEYFTTTEVAELGAEDLIVEEDVMASQEAFLAEFCEI